MDSIELGKFILELRKEKKMTQKELADILHITDKAVSKWERGLSCPDISLLSTLASTLGVSTGELLSAQRNLVETQEEPHLHEALQYANITAKHRMKSFQKYMFTIFTLLIVIAMFVCVICDLTMTSSLSWSRIPLLSMVLAWLILSPLMRVDKNRIRASLLMLSICILPYLYVLGLCIEEYPLVFSMGWMLACIGLVYVWTVYALFKKLKTKKYLASSIAMLLALVVDISVDMVCAQMMHTNVFNVWDSIGMVIMIVFAGILYILHIRNKGA